MQVDYDEYEDVLYINFNSSPAIADDTHKTEMGILVRSKEGKVVGLTFIDATFLLETTREKLAMLNNPQEQVKQK